MFSVFYLIGATSYSITFLFVHTFALNGLFLVLALIIRLLFGFGMSNSNIWDFCLDFVRFDFAFEYYITNFENFFCPYCEDTPLSLLTKAFIILILYLILAINFRLHLFIIWEVHRFLKIGTFRSSDHRDMQHFLN